jgi:hypothetical protein
MFTTEFLKKLAERAVKTFVQVFTAAMVVSQPLDLSDVTALRALVVAAVGAGISAVMSLLSSELGPTKNDPSLVDTSVNEAGLKH